ncbi:hypothetical protein BHE74_00038885 [Ensete ventricosum]|nr:hypothetical protein GW17_00025247 [Ensete ventricosum]RWW54541.1 hypothetical protein BHE74_00038885 [Ensete ventricosum]
MHCNGCARKIEKHISKMEGMDEFCCYLIVYKRKEALNHHDLPHSLGSLSVGVSSFKVDLENKKVVVVGDITPFEVLESVSKVKFAELWLA